MHHNGNFENWWAQNGLWYEKQGITKADFAEYTLKNGFTKGDIILVKGAKDPQKGDIVIFIAGTRYPIIHRVISESPLATKGDNNAEQLSIERGISKDQLLGQAVGKIPLLGWVKLIFFEPFKTPTERGLC
jgi:signal peptidase I